MAATEVPAILSVWSSRQKDAEAASSEPTGSQGPLAGAYTWPEGVTYSTDATSPALCPLTVKTRTTLASVAANDVTAVPRLEQLVGTAARVTARIRLTPELATPACVTVNVWPAIESVAVRGEDDGDRKSTRLNSS